MEQYDTSSDTANKSIIKNAEKYIAVPAKRLERAFRKVEEDREMSVFRLILSEYFRVPRP